VNVFEQHSNNRVTLITVQVFIARDLLRTSSSSCQKWWCQCVGKLSTDW